MDVFSTASDDVIALAFCAGALLLSGGLMYFSKYLSPVAKSAEAIDAPPLRLARPEYQQQLTIQEKAA